jgi:predicted lysophospholipase L1 biosynthesis ABC-type transport system permease subunit
MARTALLIVLSYAYWHSHFHDDPGEVGHTLQLNKHPFTILGIAPPDFRGTIAFVSPNFFVPLVNHEQLDGANDLNDRASRWIFMAVGHLKAGVGRAQATTDLNSIGSYLEKTYPLAAISLGVLGAMGAMLSITGIFGMAAYSVSKRLRELGLRVALGAQRTEVLKAALGRAFKLLAVGSTAGLVLGILASRVLAFVVYQATPRDPLVLVGVVLAMALLWLLATWIPARRALSVNPMILLREE